MTADFAIHPDTLPRIKRLPNFTTAGLIYLELVLIELPRQHQLVGKASRAGESTESSKSPFRTDRSLTLCRGFTNSGSPSTFASLPGRQQKPRLWRPLPAPK